MPKVSLNRGVIAGSSTFANMPGAAGYANRQWRVTDVGKNGAVFTSDGSAWYPPAGPITLLSGGIPLGLPPSGNVGSNFAITLNTALQKTYSVANTGGIYLYFAQNAINGNNSAGYYYCIMSSTTTGTVYNNVYMGNIPAAPPTTINFTGTPSGAFSLTTNTLYTAHTTIIPGNFLGITGVLRSDHYSSLNNNSNSKYCGVLFGGTVFLYSANSNVLSDWWQYQIRLQTAKSQIGAATTGPTGSTSSFVTATIDTTVNQTWSIVLKLNSSANDYNIIEAINLEFM